MISALTFKFSFAQQNPAQFFHFVRELCNLRITHGGRHTFDGMGTTENLIEERANLLGHVPNPIDSDSMSARCSRGFFQKNTEILVNIHLPESPLLQKLHDAIGHLGQRQNRIDSSGLYRRFGHSKNYRRRLILRNRQSFPLFDCLNPLAPS